MFFGITLHDEINLFFRDFQPQMSFYTTFSLKVYIEYIFKRTASILRTQKYLVNITVKTLVWEFFFKVRPSLTVTPPNPFFLLEKQRMSENRGVSMAQKNVFRKNIIIVKQFYQTLGDFNDTWNCSIANCTFFCFEFARTMLDRP